MIDFSALEADLQPLGLGDWAVLLRPAIESAMAAKQHGDFPRWAAAIDALADAGLDAAQRKSELLLLSPWRKGPFDVGGVTIDAEWRSDLKWGRIAERISPLAGRNVLDVGCGNGYYAVQMKNAGANCVLGVDPTLLYVMQFLAVATLADCSNVHVLPLRLEALPPAPRVFDTSFSMGVLYHQRSPLEHLRKMRESLRPGGELVLETIYLPGDDAFASTPPDRYARMKNVWLLPTLAELTTWLERSAFRDVQVLDRSVTTSDEQRSTEWMPFESLAEALDPDDASLTVEGWPAPHRVVFSATAPG